VFQYFKSSSKQGPVSFNPRLKPAIVFISVVKIPFYCFFIVLVPAQICILVLLIPFFLYFNLFCSKIVNVCKGGTRCISVEVNDIILDD
jgi:hypothetical protein